MHSKKRSAFSSAQTWQVRTCTTINEDLLKEGCNSDSKVRPFCNAVAESEDITEESSLLITITVPINSNSNQVLKHVVKGIREMTTNELNKLGENETSKDR